MLGEMILLLPFAALWVALMLLILALCLAAHRGDLAQSAPTASPLADACSPPLQRTAPLGPNAPLRPSRRQRGTHRVGQLDPT